MLHVLQPIFDCMGRTLSLLLQDKAAIWSVLIDLPDARHLAKFKPFYDSQFSAAASRIHLALGLIGHNGALSKLRDAPGFFRHVAESLFHNAVLERMESYDSKSAGTRLEQLDRTRKNVTQRVELPIDSNSQRLKTECGRMNAARSLTTASRQNISELQCRCDGPLLVTAANNTISHEPGTWVFAVPSEQVAQLALAQRVDEVSSRGGSASIVPNCHAHVERAVAHKRKPALGRIELHRADSNVEQDPTYVSRVNTRRAQNSWHVSKVRAQQLDALLPFQPRTCQSECRRVLVQPNVALDVASIKQRRGVPARAHRSVHENANRPVGELRDDLCQQHWRVWRTQRLRRRWRLGAACHCSGSRIAAPGAAKRWDGPTEHARSTTRAHALHGAATR
jgi:hypothetical protein